MQVVHRYKEISKCRKQFDIVTKYIHYPIATFFCALIAPTAITPNTVTALSILSELGAIWLIITNLVDYKITIVLLLQMGWVLDLSDGMLARYKKLGFYHPIKPTLKGFYFDGVSDHILRIVVLTVLGYDLVQQTADYFIIVLAGISIYAITQMEHVIRDFILKGTSSPNTLKQASNRFLVEFVLLFNNIYLFYFIFILWNRIDLLFIIFPIIQLVLLFKRLLNFSFSDY